MTFETKKFNEVFTDMQQRTTVVTDFEVGSVVRTLYESFSYEIALLYEKMQLVYLSAYVDTATGEQLDKVVAVLGVKRGLPDFAEGEVTFQRDVGNLDITIPIETLVATVDLPESPKKVYQTSEAKLFPKDQTAIAIKIQAVERGEEEVTDAETLAVLPRPLPGIKSVTNLAATRFTGKKRETDQELRQRAKNTLISSGKATLLSIENALLSLPGVKDVKVRENFRYARGEVMVNRGTATDEVVIPKGTQIVVTIPTSPEPTLKPFKTTERVVLGKFSAAIAVPVQSLIEGKVGELLQTEGISWQIIENDPLQNSILVTNSTSLPLSDFGVIEVFVDCDKFDDPIVFQQLQDEIDRVRAAGIFVILKSAVAVNLDGVFQVDPSPDLKLTPEDRGKLEQTVREEIVKYIENQQMGQPLLFAQIIKNVLSINGINNLEEFQIVASKLQLGDIPQTFISANKRIETDEFEKFNPRYLCVASEPKNLPIHLQFKITGLNETQQQTIANTLSTYFKTLKPGVAVSKTAIAAQINTASGNALVADTLTLIPQPWCQAAPAGEGAIETVFPSFIETAGLGEIFAYSQDLQITGAIKLTLPASLTDKDKLNVRNQIRAGITRYLNQLKPEADVVFADLIAIAAAINPVTAVDLTASDFQVLLDGQPTVGRVSNQKIEVQGFEKPRFDYICITSNIEPVQITVTVALELVVTNPAPPGFDQVATIAALKNAIRTTINNFLSGTTSGQTIVYANLKTGLENLIPAANYSIQQLSLTAVSSCDNRTQTTGLDTANDLYIRSVEIANLQLISLDDVVITIKTVDLPPANT
jgi:uncharacterized phage protein gp47/JayE